MEVIKERLEREFHLDLIATAPTVTYEVYLTDGQMVQIQNPNELPATNKIALIKEPFVKATIITPSEFLGNLITLLNRKRGIQTKMDYITPQRVLLEYDLPLNEIIMDFYDKLKSLTKGYASFDYEPSGFVEGDLIKLDIKVAGENVDALSIIVPNEKAMSKGREIVKAMKEIVPRQLFEVAIQASIGNKIIARETIKSMGKNVTAKCYGGDITRKRKLLEKQKEGKKRMKAIGKVNLPQEAFLSVLKIDWNESDFIAFWLISSPKTFAICNVDNSSIVRLAHLSLLTRAGIEKGVASTKAFATQVLTLWMLAIFIAQKKGFDMSEEISALLHTPNVCVVESKLHERIHRLSKRYLDGHGFFYIGRDVFYPLALEGALKLKELSYLHAEGYPAGEMKHGPITLADSKLYTIALLPQHKLYEKIKSNIEELVARDSTLLVISPLEFELADDFVKTTM